MTDPKPIACSLAKDDLRRHLDAIAAIGDASLTAREGEAGAHTLRFRPDEETRTRLEAIVAAERRCCPFLELDLGERDGELVLTIAAARDGRSVAEELAAAFG